jgi:ABC-type uncharacterized transport system ATPase subunit
MATGVKPQHLLQALVDASVELTRFEIIEPSLQSIFIAKVGDAGVVPANAEAA